MPFNIGFKMYNANACQNSTISPAESETNEITPSGSFGIFDKSSDLGEV